MRRHDFLEGTLLSLAGALRGALDAEYSARAPGFLQQFDPRAKVAGLGTMLIAAAACHRLTGVLLLLVVAVLLAVASRLSLRQLWREQWLAIGLFCGVLVAPALFLTPGEVLWRLPLVGWGITQPGLRGATLLLARVETCATFALLLMRTTPWPHVLKALRVLGLPVVIIVLLGMTYRYIFLLTQTAMEMLEARRARTLGVFSMAQKRTLLFAGMGVLLEKSWRMGQEIYSAMIARGFCGEVYLLDNFVWKKRDYVALAASLLIAIYALRIHGTF